MHIRLYEKISILFNLEDKLIGHSINEICKYDFFLLIIQKLVKIMANNFLYL